MRKLIFILFAFLLLTAPGYGKEEKVRVAVLGKSIHPYWSEVEVGVKTAAKDLGVDATFYVPPKEDIAKQISMIEIFIAQDVDGISFAASDPDAVVPVIKKALKKGIPCIANDTDAPATGRYVYIGTDNYAAGRLAGGRMAEILKGKGKVVICTGSLTAMNSLQRMQGFKDTIAKYPEIKIITTLNDNEDTSKAYSLAESALLTYPDLNGFFGVYAFNGPAAAKAVKAARKAGRVHIVCFDTTPEHMQLIKEKVIDATIGQRPYMMGYLSVVVLYNMAKIGIDNTLLLLPKTKEGDVVIDTGTDVVTPDNIEEYRKTLKRLGIPIKGW